LKTTNKPKVDEKKTCGKKLGAAHSKGKLIAVSFIDQIDETTELISSMGIDGNQLFALHFEKSS